MWALWLGEGKRGIGGGEAFDTKCGKKREDVEESGGCVSDRASQEKALKDIERR